MKEEDDDDDEDEPNNKKKEKKTKLQKLIERKNIFQLTFLFLLLLVNFYSCKIEKGTVILVVLILFVEIVYKNKN